VETQSLEPIDGWRPDETQDKGKSKWYEYLASEIHHSHYRRHNYEGTHAPAAGDVRG
jgi:hypothetical protein